jgi:hypothetical protein
MSTATHIFYLPGQIIVEDKTCKSLSKQRQPLIHYQVRYRRERGHIHAHSFGLLREKCHAEVEKILSSSVKPRIGSVIVLARPVVIRPPIA